MVSFCWIHSFIWLYLSVRQFDWIWSTQWMKQLYILHFVLFCFFFVCLNKFCTIGAQIIHATQIFTTFIIPWLRSVLCLLSSFFLPYHSICLTHSLSLELKTNCHISSARDGKAGMCFQYIICLPKMCWNYTLASNTSHKYLLFFCCPFFVCDSTSVFSH